MTNIIGYVQKNLSTMEQKPFSPVDSLILSKLCYIRFAGIVSDIKKRSAGVRIGEILRAEMLGSMFKFMDETQDDHAFLYALAASPRYRDIKMNFYTDKNDKEVEKQFSAVTFFLEDKTAYIAFRGTDTTIVGWKEDFNMAFVSPVPSQEESVKYLEAAAKRIPRRTKLRVGGHSKGGNLAVYSSVYCRPSVQKRIISVFNHDGPGFKNDIFDSPEFRSIKESIHTTIPEASLVGMLLQHHDSYKVVKSSRRGIMQHDPFSWEIEDDDYVYAESVKNSALTRNKALNEWLGTLEDDKRRLIVNVLFGVLEKTDASTFQQLSENWVKNASVMISAVKDLDSDSKKFISKTIAELAKISVRNVFSKE